MLTSNQFISCYNHLLATSIIYLTMVDPLRELSQKRTSLSTEKGDDHNRLINFVFADTTSTDQNYYDILGVKKDATKHEIHRAFRQLAKKYHPDKNKEKGAQDEFIKIFKAYETLSDEKKRKEYDDQMNGQQSSQFAGGWQTSSGGSAGMSDFDMNEFFKQYEDQFLKHAQHFSQHHHDDHHQKYHNHHQQHYQQHNHYHANNHFGHDHNKFTFHGVDLDDLFHDIDEDEFSSFGRLFSDLNGNNHNHNHLHQQAMEGTFGDGASFFGTHDFSSQLHDSLHLGSQQHHQIYQSTNRGGYSCQTTTRQVNGMMMTQTSCS